MQKSGCTYDPKSFLKLRKFTVAPLPTQSGTPRRQKNLFPVSETKCDKAKKRKTTRKSVCVRVYIACTRT